MSTSTSSGIYTVLDTCDYCEDTETKAVRYLYDQHDVPVLSICRKCEAPRCMGCAECADFDFIGPLRAACSD